MDIEKVNHILGKAVNRLLIEENESLQQRVEEDGAGNDADNDADDDLVDGEQTQLDDDTE